MDGLEYIFREIKARRWLLHDFQKGMDIANSKEFILEPSLSGSLEIAPEFLKGELLDAFQRTVEDSQKSIKESREFTLFSEGVPNFVFDGSLLYKATFEALPVVNLTVKDFNTLYKKQFNDLRQYSSITIPLCPNEPPPGNYEIIELLSYSFGGGFCDAYISIHIWSPSIQQPDRQFCVVIEDRYVPEERSSPKTEDGVTITPEAYPYNWWEQDAEEQAKITRGMQGAFLYNWWKQGRRKARPQDWPAEIIINEGTTSEQVWGQLLLSAWGHNYFNEAGQKRAYEELEGYYRHPVLKTDAGNSKDDLRDDKVIDSILMHFSKHSFNPYDAKSNMAYLKRLSSVFRMTHNQESGDFLYGGIEKSDDNLSNAVLRYLPKSIPWAHQETGIPKRTIYHLLREGKLKKAADSSKKGTDAGDIIILSDDSVEKLKQLATLKEKRKAIYEYAEGNGKSREAIKKWLQRHRDLSEDEFNNELSLWLELDTFNKQS